MSNIKDNHKDVNESALARHNELRRLHGSPPLVLDSDLSKSAQKYAEKLAKANAFAHSESGGKYGENLASSFNSRPGYIFSGAQATQNWYDEIKDYKFNQEQQTIQKIGHFSQVVWKDSKLAGFGRAQSANGNFIIVGQYKPPGNFIGNFKENVNKPTGKPTPLPDPNPPTTSNEGGACKSSHTTKNKVETKTKPKSSKDVLIKQSTKTKTENGKKTIEITETWKTPTGSTYDQKKTTTTKA